MEFYQNFIKLCNTIGKSPSRVALDIGVSKPSVTRWKAGSVPSDAVIRKLADYFEVSVTYLKGEEDSITVDGITISPEEKNLFNLIKALTDDEVKQVSDYIDFVISKRGK